jgi:hypothetical protein
MRPDFLGVYSPPGIYTNPIKGPQLAVNSSLPQAVGLVGTTVGFQTYTEGIQFRDTDEEDPETYNLTQQGIKRSSIVVRSAETLVAWPGASNNGNTTHYTVETVSGTIDSNAAKYAIKRNATSTGIAADAAVQVSYEYTDEAYYNARTFYDYRDVVATYGQPFTINELASGGITWEVASELTLAAKFAFLNGAYKVVCVAVDPSGTTASSVDYQEALEKLKDDPAVAIVVPCNGVTSADAVKNHVREQSGSRYERRAILGFDGQETPVSTDSRIGTVRSIDNDSGADGTSRRIMVVSPSQFTCYSPEVDKTIVLGGQYMAASLAGMCVSMSFAQPLTRKYPVGWKSIGEKDVMREGQMNNETVNGLCVVEYDRRKNLRIRHGVSARGGGPSNLLDREWSITGQEDALVYRLRDYLDDANLIGQPIYNYTLVNVKASAEAALQSLVRDSLLVDYTGLAVRQLLTNPDVIEISFGWKPAFPLNYIILTFGVNLNTGSLNVNSAGNRNNFTSTTQTTINAPAPTMTGSFGGTSNTLQSF